jgi:hypothetical protein
MVLACVTQDGQELHVIHVRNTPEKPLITFLELIQLSTTGLNVSYNSVKVNAWSYYNLTVASATTILVHVKEVSTFGFVHVYIAKTTPTLTNYLYGDFSGHSVHRIAIDTPQGGVQSFIVGVYGDAEQVDPNGAAYGIVAWSPTF